MVPNVNLRNIHSLAPQPPLPFQAAVDYADTVLGWAQDVPGELVLATQVHYGPDPAQQYDVFGNPASRNRPVLVFWHGGGWTNGYREYVSFMAPHVARLGCVLVAPSYRLAPQHRLPAAYEDGLAALSHVAGNAGAFGGDGRHLYLAGHSAGAHLAALLALRRADWQRAGIPEQAVRACMPISGIMDLHHPAPAPGTLEERVYTMVLGHDADDATMSPLCWGAGNTVPILLSHGDADSERVRRSNQRLAALLALQPGPCELHVEPGQDHFMTHLALQDPQANWYERLARLLQAGTSSPTGDRPDRLNEQLGISEVQP